MKKIFLFILLAFMITPVFSKGDSSETYVKKIAIENFNRLIIRSNITVMLIEVPSEDSVRIEGSKKFIEKVMIIQAGKELTVRSKSFKDQKKKGIIYIPVRLLQNIEISAAAKVISYNILQSPVLNILINGDCVIDLMLKGRLNIREAEGYNFTYHRIYEKKQSSLVQNKNLNH
jgi:Putative auto-transporter adhesin, head GIN domain